MWQESSYGKKGGEIRYSELWVNTETESSLAAQTITLSEDDLNDYDFISVLYQNTTGANPGYYWESGLCKMSEFLGGQQSSSSYPSGRPLMFGFQNNSTASNLYFRYLAFERDTQTSTAHKIYISQGYKVGSTAAQNSYCIIREIHGWKMTDVRIISPI